VILLLNADFWDRLLARIRCLRILNDDYAYSPFRLNTRLCPKLDGTDHHCVVAHGLGMYCL
jgi:hypothetical protein